jgi:holo-[acyl-carrier protein] synthase
VIHGVGTDIVGIGRMQRNLQRFGDRFARRILTEGEYQDFRHALKPAHFLAKRFAAKEALAKALGTGFRQGLGLRSIAITHDGHGRPLLEFLGRARELMREHGIAASHLSLSDEAEYAVAFVVLEK